VGNLWADLDRAKVRIGPRRCGERALNLDWVAGPEAMGRATQGVACRLDAKQN
jgi:hypothetical protein